MLPVYTTQGSKGKRASKPHPTTAKVAKAGRAADGQAGRTLPVAPIKTLPVTPIKIVPVAPTKTVLVASTKYVPVAPTKTVPAGPIKTVPVPPIKTVPVRPIKTVPIAPIKASPAAGSAPGTSGSQFKPQAAAQYQTVATVPTVTASNTAPKHGSSPAPAPAPVPAPAPAQTRSVHGADATLPDQAPAIAQLQRVYSTVRSTAGKDSHDRPSLLSSSAESGDAGAGQPHPQQQTMVAACVKQAFLQHHEAALFTHPQMAEKGQQLLRSIEQACSVRCSMPGRKDDEFSATGSIVINGIKLQVSMA